MPRYTGAVVSESLVLFHSTFSSRLASRFLRWKAHACVFEGFAKANSPWVLLLKSIVIDTYLQIAMYIILGANANYVNLSSDIVAVVSRHWSSSHTLCNERVCIEKYWPHCLSAEAHIGGFWSVGKLKNPRIIIRINRDCQEFGPMHALTFRRSDSRITPQPMKSVM